MNIPPIKATIRINADVRKVWEVLFNENGWDGWFTEGMKVEPFEGGRIMFRWIIEGEEVVDHGINRLIIPYHLWEFEWNEYEDGYKSKVTIELIESANGGVWVSVTDRFIAFKEEDLEEAFRCAAGWGEFLARLKLWVERGIVL